MKSWNLCLVKPCWLTMKVITGLNKLLNLKKDALVLLKEFIFREVVMKKFIEKELPWVII